MSPTRRKNLAESAILTPRQLQILRLIDVHRRSVGCSPTLQELADSLNISRITVFEHVEALVEKGLLRRRPNKARSLTINPRFKLPRPPNAVYRVWSLARSAGGGAAGPASGGGTGPASGGLQKTQAANGGSLKTGRFPLVGVIAAGLPLEAFENVDQLDLTSIFPSGADTFALQVRGDSMIEEQIRAGDFVLAEKNAHPRDGQIVVALLENGETTLKKFYRQGRRCRLEAANPAYPPILTDRLNVQGVVIGVIRKY